MRHVAGKLFRRLFLPFLFLTGITCWADFVGESVIATSGAVTGAFAKVSNNTIFFYHGEKQGKIFVSKNIHTSTEHTKLALKLDVCGNLERGVQSLVTHPKFAQNGWVYIYRTRKMKGCVVGDRDRGPRNRLSRFTADLTNGKIQLGTELVMFDTPPDVGGVHNGGAMKFGKDGLLYIGTGDDGAHSQDLTTLSGVIIRLTDNGDIPTSNPFPLGTSNGRLGVRCNQGGVVPNDQSASDTVCSEIFAYGMRNPSRMALDEDSNPTKLYLGW